MRAADVCFELAAGMRQDALGALSRGDLISNESLGCAEISAGFPVFCTRPPLAKHAAERGTSRASTGRPGTARLRHGKNPF